MILQWVVAHFRKCSLTQMCLRVRFLRINVMIFFSLFFFQYSSLWKNAWKKTTYLDHTAFWMPWTQKIHQKWEHNTPKNILLVVHFLTPYWLVQQTTCCGFFAKKKHSNICYKNYFSPENMWNPLHPLYIFIQCIRTVLFSYFRTESLPCTMAINNTSFISNTLIYNNFLKELQ